MIQHGTLYAYVQHRCRCAPCADARRAYRQQRLATPLEPDDPRHGSYTAYKDFGCRCAPCRVAYKLYRVRRARVKAAA